jgi:Mg2+ and Co2+ transporter CorA
MIKLLLNGEVIDVKWYKFSDGAITCKVPQFKDPVFQTGVVVGADVSTPDTRNIDTLRRQAERLVKRASSEPDYVKFVAQNMVRIADEFAETLNRLQNKSSALEDELIELRQAVKDCRLSAVDEKFKRLLQLTDEANDV